MIDIKNAKLVALDNSRRWATFELSSMFYNALLLFKHVGEFVRLRISRVVKARTTGDGSQSHHINGHCQQLAIETGNTFADVKTACKLEAISRGYPFRSIIIRQNAHVVPYSETEIDTVQAGYLIDTIHQIADELDIVLKEE